MTVPCPAWSSPVPGKSGSPKWMPYLLGGRLQAGVCNFTFKNERTKTVGTDEGAHSWKPEQQKVPGCLLVKTVILPSLSFLLPIPSAPCASTCRSCTCIPAVSKNYRGSWLPVEEAQAIVLQHCVTSELLGKKCTLFLKLEVDEVGEVPVGRTAYAAVIHKIEWVFIKLNMKAIQLKPFHDMDEELHCSAAYSDEALWEWMK